VTVGDWLAARTPPPPPELAARVREALGDALMLDAATIPDAALVAAERLLESLLARGCASREQAGALLTADALVTYAFEGSAEDPASVTALAERMMRRIAVLLPAGAA